LELGKDVLITGKNNIQQQEMNC